MQAKQHKELNDEHLEFARVVTKQVMARFKVSPHFFDDYLSAAYMGMVEAATRYDPNTEVPFDKYAYLRVRGAVIDHVRRSAGLTAREYKAVQLLQASNCLAEDFQSFRTRFSSDDIDQQLSEVLDFAAKGALLFRINYLECEEEIVEQAEGEGDAEEESIRRERNRVLQRAIETLPIREQIIIQSFYFDGLTFQEIADERLHVTRSWVSRMHSRAIQQLREVLSESASLLREHRK